jgi:hypothetical protein
MVPAAWPVLVAVVAPAAFGRRRQDAGNKGHVAPVRGPARRGALAAAAINAPRVGAVRSRIGNQLVACRATEAPVRVG